MGLNRRSVGCYWGALLLIGCARPPESVVSDFSRETSRPPHDVGGRPLIAGRWHARFTVTECAGPCARNATASGTLELAAQRHTVPFDSLLGHALEPSIWGWDGPDSLFFHVGPNASHGWLWVEAAKVGTDSAEGHWACSGYCIERGTVVLQRLY